MLWQVARELTIEYICDYCLVLVVEDSAWRLDYHDLICDIVGEDQEEPSEEGSMFMRFIDRGIRKARELFTKDSPRLMLMKFLYLPQPFEDQHLLRSEKETEQRLRILID